MGCVAQVHEKTDKCGTWACHSVNRWYLFTSPEHYCTHSCDIKHTKSKRLSDTVQLQYKRITNSSITHTNKVMHALAECVKANQGMMGKARNSHAIQDLQRIVDATQAQVQGNPHKFEETITPDDIRNTQQVPRVQAPPSVPIPRTNDNRQITLSMHLQAPIPRVGCPQILLHSNPSARPLSQPPSNLATNPPHWLPSCPNVNAIVSGKQHGAMLLLQPAQPHS
jgi:hypothetical protein